MHKSGNRLKRIAALTLSSVLIVSIASGCKSGTTKSQDTKPTAESTQKVEEPTPISIMTQFYSKTAPSADFAVQKEVEKMTNTKLTITWVPSSTYSDKMSLSIASGEIPDAILISDPHRAAIRTYFSQGVFWDLTSLYKDYKTLAGFPEVSWLNTKAPDGKNYVIPRPRPDTGNNAFMFRSDLFEKEGIKLPSTTDELYDALKKLTKSNPGFTGFVAQTNTSSGLSWELQIIMNSFTKANGLWKDVNGKMTFVDLLPEMKDSLTYLKKLYDEKLINEDFTVLKDFKSIMYSGKWIASIGGSLDNSWTVQKEMAKIDPKAKALCVASMNGVARRDSGYFGGYAINKKVPEDKLKKIMTFFDRASAQEVSDVILYGLKDVHYKMENGVRTSITGAPDLDYLGGNTLGQVAQIYDKYLRTGIQQADMPKDLVDYNKKIVDEQIKISIGEPGIGLYSPTNDKYFPDIEKKSADMKLKVILGKEPMSSWDKYVEGLKADATLTKCMEELSDAYKKKMGK